MMLFRSTESTLKRTKAETEVRLDANEQIEIILIKVGLSHTHILIRCGDSSMVTF